MQADVLLGLMPQWCRVGVAALEEPGQGVVGRPARPVRLNPCGFRAGEDERRGNQKIDVVQVGNFRLVHARTIPPNPSTA